MKKFFLPFVFACLLLFTYQINDILAQPFSVYISAFGDSDNIAGTAIGALDGLDFTHDILEEVAYPTLYFPHPDWNKSQNIDGVSYDPLADIRQWSLINDIEKERTATTGTKYKHDIQTSYDPLSEIKQWTFVVDVDVAYDQSSGTIIPTYVALDFTPSFEPYQNISIQLHNYQSGETTEISPPYSYGYSTTYDGLHSFDLIIGSEPTFNDLELVVDVYSNDRSDMGNRASTSTNATDDYDSGLDIPEPGPAPGNFLVGSFYHTDWPMGPRFQTDVRAPFDPLNESKTWLFQVEVENEQSGSVTLDFTPNFSQTEQYPLMLKDLSSGQTYDLFPSLTYSYPHTAETTRSFEITIGSSGVTPPPALSPEFRMLEAGWAMVGFPLTPQAGQNTLGEVIMNQAPGYSYSFLYEGTQGYAMQNASDIIVPGYGYWFATDTAFDWSMQGDIPTGPVTISLMNGWNLVSNPLWFPGPVEGVLVNYQGNSYPWIDAVNMGLIHSAVMDYNTTNDYYFQTQDLTAWKGYWFCAEANDISLTFDWHQFQLMPPRFSQPPVNDDPASLSWRTDFIATTAENQSHVVTFGVNDKASSGFDPWQDIPLAPVSPVGGGQLAILHPEWNLSCGSRFATDHIQPTEDSVLWNIEFKDSQSDEVTLSWTRFDWPAGLDFQVVIPSQNRVVVMSMREQNSIVLPIDSRGLVVQVRTPEMTTGADDIPQFKYSMTVTPNPFNPQTTIFFNLEQPGNVQLKIFTIRGELVESLTAEALAAGQHEMVWQGQDQAGRSVPSGSYFVKMYMNGNPVGAVTKMSLIR